MATYYVSPTGTTGGAGTNGDPWTLARALATTGYATLVTGGDTVMLKDGTYYARLQPRTANVTFQAVNEQRAIIDGRYHEQLSDFNIFTNSTCQYLTNTNYVIIHKTNAIVDIDIDNITIDGLFIRNVAGRGINVTETADGTNILNCRVDFCYNALINITGTNTLVEDCLFTRGGICYFADRDRGRCGGCNNCYGGGPAAVPVSVNAQGSTNTTFRRCEAAYSYGEGFCLGKNGSGGIVENCKAHNNKHANIYINRHVNPIVRNNLVWSGQLQAMADESQSGKFQPCILVRDEEDDTPKSTGQQIYNNILIGGKSCILVSSGNNNFTTLEDAYIAHNTCIGIGNNGILPLVTESTFKIEANAHGHPHVNSLVENNVFIHLGTAGLGALTQAGNVQGVAFRNNLWSRPNGGSNTPDSQYVGDGDVNTSTPNFVNLVDPIDRGIVDQLPFYSIHLADYGPKANSAALNAASDGSAINGATIVNVTTDINGVTRPTTKTQRDLGAIEYGGTASDPGTVTAAFAIVGGVTSGNAPFTVEVNESSSTTAGSPAATLTRWVYEWGDGAIDTMTTGANITHVYQAGGVFTLRLTVENSNGASDDVTATITVSADRSAPVLIDVRIDAVPTDTSDLDVIWDLDGATPKAGLFFLTAATATNTDTAPAALSVGFWGKDIGAVIDDRGQSEFWRLNDAATRDGTQGWSASREYAVVNSLSSAGAVDGTAYVKAVFADTIRLGMSDTFPAARQLVSIGLSGSKLRAAQRRVVFGLDSRTFTLALPFTPDLIFVSSTFTADASGSPIANRLRSSFGIGTPSQQWALAWGDSVRLSPNRVAQNHSNSRASVAVETWGANALTFRRYGPIDDIKSISVLALNVDGRAELSSILTPTTTSATDYSLSATPSFVMALMSQLAAAGFSNAAPGGSAGIYVTDGSDDYSIVWRSESGADPLDTGSAIHDSLKLTTQTAAALLAGTTALGTDKWTATLSTAPATAQTWPVLAIATSDVPTGLVADFSADTTTIPAREDVTFTDRSDDNGDTITTWIIDYGDGVSESNTDGSPFVHAYTSGGFYTVRLLIQSATDQDEEVKINYIHVIGAISGDGEIYGPYLPQTVTNYSENKVGSSLNGATPGESSHALDLDVVLIDEEGPEPGWTAVGGKMLIGYDSATEKLRFVRSDGKEATLALNWITPGGNDDPGGTVVRQVSRGVDDGHQLGAGVAPVLDNNTIILSAGTHSAAARFLDIPIPKGANITAATLEVTTYSTTYDDFSLLIYGEDADNSAGLTTDIDDISGRTKTSASVAWTAAAVGVGTIVSDDIKSVIQEIVNRAGWVAGNALTILFDPDGSHTARWRSYDYRSDLAAKLTVTYTN